MYTRKRLLESNQGEIGETCKLQTIQSELVYSIANIKMSGTVNGKHSLTKLWISM